MKFIILLNIFLTGCITICIKEVKNETIDDACKTNSANHYTNRKPDVTSRRADLNDYYNWDVECDCWMWSEDKKKIKGKIIIGEPFIEFFQEK